MNFKNFKKKNTQKLQFIVNQTAVSPLQWMRSLPRLDPLTSGLPRLNTQSVDHAQSTDLLTSHDSIKFTHSLVVLQLDSLRSGAHSQPANGATPIDQKSWQVGSRLASRFEL